MSTVEVIRAVAEVKKVEEEIDLSQLTTFKMFGKAKIIRPSDLGHFTDLIQCFIESGKGFKVLGGGSNTIIRDNCDIPIVLTSGLNHFKIEGNSIIAESGVKLSTLASKAAELGLSGLEFSKGIPGTVGGATYMNTGAFDGEMSECIECVEAIDENGKFIELHHDELKFSYRHSVFHEKNFLIRRCVLNFNSSTPEKVNQKMYENYERKRKTQPLSFPSVGCVFENPKGDYAARLIDEAGLKGFKVGGVEVSRIHAGFFVNVGGATFEDFRSVYERVVGEVKNKFGVELKPEITIL